MRWRDLSFRWKLALSFIGIVGAASVGVLWVTSMQIAASYEQMFAQSFERDLSFFRKARELRLQQVQRSSGAISRSVRWTAAFTELEDEEDRSDTVQLLYDNVRIELARPEAKDLEISRASFYRLLDRDGKVITPPDERAGLVEGAVGRALAEQLAARALGELPAGGSAFISLTRGERPTLYEIISSPVRDRATGEHLGAIVFGFATQFPARAKNNLEPLVGIWHDTRLYSDHLTGQLGAALEYELRKTDFNSVGRRTIQNGARAYTLHVADLARANAAGAKNIPTAHISLYPRDQEIETQAQLRSTLLALGSVSIIAGLGLSLFLAHSLAVPITALVKATNQVQAGQFDTRVTVRGRDELGQLSASFNDMTAGLALKEKYRSVLEVVADKAVAEELMSGKLTLGGEVREVTTLFCDIRGFTALTEKMEPSEVIKLLNEHFTPLTEIVYAHHGIVDKFVGDLIMGVFGAPRNDPQHALHAAQCALQMIQRRTHMNETSSHRIEIGIGIASGRAIAGTMGAENRLSYTVVGERVNLASRLCSQAGPAEIIIDATTRAALPITATIEPLPPVKLKGFAEPVQTYKLTATAL